MKLKVRRVRQFPDRTIGQFYVDEEFFCFTLEDQVRPDPNLETPENEAKVYAETAIPEGRYKISLVTSPKFGENTIYLHDVPGYKGILIHGGVTPQHTAGCILVGYKLSANGQELYQSKQALLDLKEKIKTSIKNKEEVTIDVVN